LRWRPPVCTIWIWRRRVMSSAGAVRVSLGGGPLGAVPPSSRHLCEGHQQRQEYEPCSG
jgi:hypothetical protein